MKSIKCITTYNIECITDDGFIGVEKGDMTNSIIIKIRNIDNQSTSICITKKELNNIVKLVNEKL